MYAPTTHTNYGSEGWTQKRAPSLQTAARWQDPAFGSRTYDRAWVNATGGGPLPTGTVTFHLCGPFNSATACNAGGAFNGTRTLPGSAPNQVDSDKFLGGGVLIHQRWYCFRAEYSGDANYLAATHTNATTECFQHVEPQ